MIKILEKFNLDCQALGIKFKDERLPLKYVEKVEQEMIKETLSQIYQELKKCVPAKKEKEELIIETVKEENGWIAQGIIKGHNQAIDTIHKNLKKACGEK